MDTFQRESPPPTISLGVKCKTVMDFSFWLLKTFFNGTLYGLPHGTTSCLLVSTLECSVANKNQHQVCPIPWRAAHRPENANPLSEMISQLMRHKEAGKFQGFIPLLEEKNLDNPWQLCWDFLRNAWTRSLLTRNANLVFPQSTCDVVQPPRLDKVVKDQLLHAERPGLEIWFWKTLLVKRGNWISHLSLAWSLQPDARPSNTQIIHIRQRVLGGTSQVINAERRWAPKLKALADEDYKGRNVTLFRCFNFPK